MASTTFSEIRLLNGDAFEVEGTVAEVERKLSDAARSGASRLAWLTEHATEAPVGINPANVASLRQGEDLG